MATAKKPPAKKPTVKKPASSYAERNAALEAELKRQNQSGLYKNESIAKSGNMSGAKFRIEGAISSITKQNKDIKDIYYIFNLSLVNIETGLIEWADEKEIRKIEQR